MTSAKKENGNNSGNVDSVDPAACGYYCNNVLVQQVREDENILSLLSRMPNDSVKDSFSDEQLENLKIALANLQPPYGLLDNTYVHLVNQDYLQNISLQREHRANC